MRTENEQRTENPEREPSRSYSGKVKRPSLPTAVRSSVRPDLQRGFDLETPRLEQGLRDELGILVAPRPLAQADGADVLVGSELELLDYLLKLGDGGDDGPDGFGLAPVRISASLWHDEFVCLLNNGFTKSEAATDWIRQGPLGIRSGRANPYSRNGGPEKLDILR